MKRPRISPLRGAAGLVGVCLAAGACSSHLNSSMTRHVLINPDRASKQLLSRIAKATLIRGQKLEPPQNRFFSKTTSYLCSNGIAQKLRLKLTSLKQRHNCQLQPRLLLY